MTGGTRSTRRIWRIGGALVLVLLLGSCAAGANPQITSGGSGAGFWLGLWHGFITPVTFIVSLFRDDVNVYEVRNVGNWYDLGFVLGLAAIFGAGRGPSYAVRSARGR
jgi:hypothetical protein